MLGLGADLQPGLHHPYMRFDHSCIMDGGRNIETNCIESVRRQGLESSCFFCRELSANRYI